MKQFFKILLASMLGMLLVVFITLGVLMSAFKTTKPVEVKANSILKIALNKTVDDRAGIPTINPISMTIESNLGLNNILFGIEQAKNDSRIKGIYLNLSTVNAGLASVEEIRNALIDFKQSKKYIIAYAENYSQKAYLLATVADKIYLNPLGNIDFKGMRSEITFYKGLLEKLGIDVQIIRHGKFKSAIEPFTLDKMSSENREQIMTYIGSIWNFVVESISTSRQISPEELNNIANNMDLALAEDALNRKFVDKLMYEDEVLNELKKYTESETLNITNISNYYTPGLKQKKGAKIAIIYASGEIMSGGGNDSFIMSDDMVKAIRSARKDSTVKAIVFRVNSPGGSAQASEIIARELELAKGDKPVVVSMGNLAASGGYWISTPGNKLFANRTTLTGSIGVFGMIPNMQKGMTEKLGITVDVATTNNNADFPSITRPLRDSERNYLQKSVENIYSVFLSKVASSRNLSISIADSIGQGRVWSGINALDINLIDYFGGLKESVAEAAKLANISNYSIVELPKELSTIEMLMKSFEAKLSQKTNNELTNALKHYEYVISMLNNYGIMAKMPYNIEIH